MHDISAGQTSLFSGTMMENDRVITDGNKNRNKNENENKNENNNKN